MYVIAILLAASVCTAAQTNSFTWDGIIRQHCDALPDAESDVPPPFVPIPDGPRGPVGPPGGRGETGRRGPPGPTADLNKTRVDEIFQESFAAEPLPSNEPQKLSVSRKPSPWLLYPNVKTLEIPADYAKPSNQPNRQAPINTEWTVFQRRLNGEVDFYRIWDDYVRGFGSTDGEFWLGLEDIHQLTKSGRYELRIDMISINGTHLVANYDFFKLFPSTDNYRLLVSGYSGNASDALSYHSSFQFSTKDQDHDAKVSRNCAERHKGAWWYNRCQTSNLNGRYESRSVRGLRWYRSDVKESIRLQFTEMKFRQIV